MSFEIGGISNHNSKVEGTFLSKEGGGGNTGYFQYSKEDEHEKKSGQDVFELSSEQNADDEVSIGLKDIKIIKVITTFLNAILNKFLSIFNIKIEFNHKK